MSESDNEWLEASVTVVPEIAEAVSEVLSRYAPRGVVIETTSPGDWEHSPVTVRAYVPYDDQVSSTKRSIQAAMGHLNQIHPVPPPTFRRLTEADWSEAWKQNFHVLHIGQHIVIRPSWCDYIPRLDDVVIHLDPGMAFGTGLHPTTQMCLEALEQRVRPGDQVLDIGTGTGILAICAARLGASLVVGVDNDPVAVRMARENVRLNQVEDSVTILAGSLSNVSGQYDIIVVNILAKVIIKLLDEGLTSLLAPDGHVIATGIITDQAEAVVMAMEKQKLLLIKQQQKDDWVCLIACRNL